MKKSNFECIDELKALAPKEIYCPQCDEHVIDCDECNTEIKIGQNIICAESKKTWEMFHFHKKCWNKLEE